MIKSLVFEVRSMKRGKVVTLARFSNLVDACNYAENENDSSHEPVFVVRVDYECVVVFDAYPVKSVPSLNSKRCARK